MTSFLVVQSENGSFNSLSQRVVFEPKTHCVEIKFWGKRALKINVQKSRRRLNGKSKLCM
jgi:hypothetical protein